MKIFHGLLLIISCPQICQPLDYVHFLRRPFPIPCHRRSTFVGGLPSLATHPCRKSGRIRSLVYTHYNLCWITYNDDIEVTGALMKKFRLSMSFGVLVVGQYHQFSNSKMK